MTRPLVILFTHGGGIRGLIPAHFMARFEEATGRAISDLVDIFTGPSTGAILNAAMNLRHPDDRTKPRYKARQLVRFYEREGQNIFPHDAFRSMRGFVHDLNNRTLRIPQLDRLFRHGHYERVNLGRALRALYGRAKLGDARRSLFIPIYAIDGLREGDTTQTGGKAVWLKHLAGTTLNNRATTPIVDMFDAVMATTAAPTYFPCHGFEMTQIEGGKPMQVAAIDGSVFDNPCTTYWGAVRQHLAPDQPVIMIVLGTGLYNRGFTREQWDQYGPIGVVDPANDLPLINVFLHASETALSRNLQAELGANMHVFNKSLVSGPFLRDYPSTEIDDASPDNIRRLRNFTEMAIEEQRKEFDALCQLLVKIADERDKETHT
ncbi:MAG: patatin-like phospholipase family protein [Pseudomonadota bacterium]